MRLTDEQLLAMSQADDAIKLQADDAATLAIELIALREVERAARETKITALFDGVEVETWLTSFSPELRCALSALDMVTK